MKYLAILLLFIAQFSFAQNKSVSKIIDQIEFQNDTLLAVYNWMTDNIKYDVGKVKKLEKGVDFYKKGNFKNPEEYSAFLLEEVIKKKKGVCDDYTLLFNSIVTEMGYTAHIVRGVTKDDKGRVRNEVGHSWNAVKVNGVWKLFDPTWGAGYVDDRRKFVKNYSDIWYDVEPDKMIETHFPYDMIWQLSENPSSYTEFAKGKTAVAKETAYNFEELIASHLEKDEKGQLIDELERSKSNGGHIKPIKKRRAFLQKRIDNYDRNSNADLIQNTLNDCRDNSMQFGEYINAKNQRFKGKKWTVEYSIQTLEAMQPQLQESINTLKSIDVNDSKSKKIFKKYIAQTEDLLKRVQKELVFLGGK